MPNKPADLTAPAKRWLTAIIAVAAAYAVPPAAAQTAEQRAGAVQRETLGDLLQRAEQDYRLSRGKAMLSRLAPAAPLAPASAAEAARATPVEAVRPAPVTAMPPAGLEPAPPARPLAAIPPVLVAPHPGTGETLRERMPKVPEVRARELEPAPPASAAVPKAQPPRAEAAPERAVTYTPAEAAAPPPAAVERRLAPVHCRDLLARAQLGDVTQAEMTLLRTQCH